LGYIAKSVDDKFFVVYDGREDANRFEEIKLRNVHTSADGKHVAYFAEPQSFRTVAVVDGKVGKVYDDISEDSLAISADGSRFGYAAKERNKKAAKP
jgi:hypothetical protein